MSRLALIAALAAALPIAAFAQGRGSHLIENWDQDGDAVVTLAEIEQRRADIFASFDADENGVLDAGEYAVFDEARASHQAEQGRGGGHGRGARLMRLEANDANGDGTVSAEEFRSAAADWLAAMDRNGDGAVTRDDFGPR